MALIYAQIDCDLPRDTRMIAAGPLGRLLYIQCVLYARENLTDGFIERLWLPLIAPDIPRVLTHCARLVDVGALEETLTGWQIPERVWRKRNPLKTEVDASRQAEADRKARYREKSQRDKAGTDGDVPTGQGVTATSRPRQEKPEEETEPKTEEKPKPSASSSVDNSSSARGTPAGGSKTQKPKNGNHPTPSDPRLDDILDRYQANAWNSANRDAIVNPDAFRASKRTEALEHPDLGRLLREYPTASASEIAAWLTGERNSMRYHERAVS